MTKEIAISGIAKGLNTSIATFGDLDAGSEHPKTNIPFNVMIDGRLFSGKTLSLTSAIISGLAASDFTDIERLATLNFPFGAYSISVVAEVKISKLDQANGEYSIAFLEPTGNHLPTLRYILNSYVSGDIVSLGSIISLREKAGAPSAAKSVPKMTFGQRLAFLARALATILFTLVLLFVFASLAYDRLLTKNVNDLASFSQGGEPVRAIVSGQLSYVNAEAMHGDVIYSIFTSKRETVNVVNPCECSISFGAFALGSTILVGETVAELVRPDSIQSVIVNLDPEDARKLLSGDIAQLTLPNTMLVVSSREMAISQIPGSEKVRAAFSLVTPIEGVASGTPVPLRIVNGTFASIRERFQLLYALNPSEWFKKDKQQELDYGKDPSFNSMWWRRYPPLATVSN